MRSIATLPAPLPGPSAGGSSWQIDPAHSHVEFAVRHLMISTVKGAFGDVRGAVWVDESDARTVLVDVTIQVASIDTRQEQRDAHLRSADFFDAARFPTITFQSVRVEPAGRRTTVLGRLSLHGVTREIAVPVDVQITDTALVATGEFIVNRGDYAMNYNSLLNPIGNEVRVAFTFRARVP